MSLNIRARGYVVRFLMIIALAIVADPSFAQPDYTATKSNDTGGAGTVGVTFNWNIVLANSGSQGTWGSGTIIFADSFPGANVAYGTPIVTGVTGVTGSNNISCAFVNVSRLVCRVNSGSVVFSAGSSVTVQVPSTPSVAGVFVNPTGGNCAVNPIDDVVETNFSNNNCSPDTVTVTTGAVGPDLTIAKTNNRSGTTSGNWTWSIQTGNGGTTNATFSSGQVILRDNLPNAGVAYGSPTITAQSGISGTGSVSCSIASFNLTCTASGGSVVLAPTATFTVNVFATPSASGVFANPRGGGVCMADPDGNIAEGNEANNSCSDSITVNATPDYTATKTNSTGGAGTVGVPFNWSIAITNVSADPGTWTDGTILFADSFPSANMAYGTPIVTGVSGVTGSNNISCAFVNVSRLVCRVQGGSLVFSGGGSVTIQVPSTPSIAGVFVNPTGGNCAVNPVDDVVELNSTNNTCSDSVSVTTGVVGPDLTIAKTNNRGGTTSGNWTWSIQTGNGGNQNAVFSSGQTILTDNLPNSGVAYGSPTITAQSGISGTGTISCSIVSFNLTCTAAGGSVTLAPTGTFTVNTLATPSASGTFVNPRGGGICMADPGGVITEGNEGNNSCADTVTVNPTPDYIATKTNDTGGAGTAGVLFNWSIDVRNISADPGTWTDGGILFVDSFPPGNISYGTPTVSAASGVTNSNRISCSFVNPTRLVCRIVGGSVTFSGGGSVTIQVPSTPSGDGVFVNPTGGNCAVNALDDVLELNTTNNACTDTVTVSSEADVSVTKTDGVTTAVPGQSVTYTIVAANSGPSADPSVSLTDTFPTELTCTYTSVAAGGATGNTAAGAGNLAETLNLPAGSSVTYTASCNIDSSATGTLSNTASVSGSITDPTPGNNSATDANTVLTPQADISVTKTDGVTSAIPGQSLTYTIVASNNGPSDDPSVSLADTFPADLTCTFTSVAAGGATGNTAAGSGDLAETLSMPSGSSVTYTVSCNIASSATGTLSNTATVSASVTDPTPGNNSATDADTVLAPQADISVTKTDGVTSAIPGQSLTYTIIASNNGPSDDPSVSLTDTFPADLTCTFTSVAAGGATGNTAAGSGDLAETLNMPSGSSVTYTVNCNIASSATGTLSNTATVTASVTDPTPGNDSATDADTVLAPEADISVTKTDGVTSASPGQTLTYTIVVSNSGPSDDPSVSLADTLPTDLTCTFTSIAAGGATGNTAAGAGDLAETLSMPSGSSVTYTLDCNIAGGATGTLSNTATATASVTDPAPGNNSATDADTSLIQEADVSVTVTDGVTSAVPGQTTLTYSIVATNSGPSDDPSVSLTDTFPADLTCTFTSTAAGGATGNTAAGSGDLAESLNMPSGSSVTYTVNCDIASSATGTLSNTATAVTSITDTTPANNSATDADTVLTPEADISVTKTDGITSVIPGQTLSYTIVVSNSGPSDDPAVSLNDTLPTDLTCTFTSVAAGGATGNTAAGSGDLAETLNMPTGSSVTYTVDCNIASSATGTLSNTATATASVTDPTPANNSATDGDTVLTPEADISVTKTDGITSAIPGQTLTYTIVVSNGGPSDDPAVTLADTLPADLTCTFTSAATGGATGNTAAGSGDLAETLNLPSGSSVTYTVDCNIDSSATGTLSNTATVTASVTDPTAGNNSATDADTVLTPEADISVTKTDGGTSAVPGETVTYTVVVSNAGPSDDPSVSLTDTLPANLTCTFTSVPAGGATGNTAAGSGDLSETLNMPSGSSVTYTIDCDIPSSATGTLSNTASATGSVTDPTPGNDSATDSDTVLSPLADLSITKSDGGSLAIVPGTPIIYTLTVTNAGPSDSSGGVATDVLPQGLSFVSSSTGCTDLAGTVTCPFGPLVSGDNVELSFVAFVAVNQTDPISNSASVTGNEADIDNNNNAATQVTTIALTVPTLSVWAMILLAGLLVWIVWTRRLAQP